MWSWSCPASPSHLPASCGYSMACVKALQKHCLCLLIFLFMTTKLFVMLCFIKLFLHTELLSFTANNSFNLNSFEGSCIWFKCWVEYFNFLPEKLYKFGCSPCYKRRQTESRSVNRQGCPSGDYLLESHQSHPNRWKFHFLFVMPAWGCLWDAPCNALWQGARSVVIAAQLPGPGLIRVGSHKQMFCGSSQGLVHLAVEGREKSTSQRRIPVSCPTSDSQIPPNAESQVLGLCCSFPSSGVENLESASPNIP